MADIEVGEAAFQVDVTAVLRIIRIPRTAEEARGVVDGFRPGIRGIGRQTAAQGPPDASLQTLVVRIAARLDDVDVVELRYRPRIRLLRAGQRLIEIARANQLGAFRTS